MFITRWQFYFRWEAFGVPWVEEKNSISECPIVPMKSCISFLSVDVYTHLWNDCRHLFKDVCKTSLEAKESVCLLVRGQMCFQVKEKDNVFLLGWFASNPLTRLAGVGRWGLKVPQLWHQHTLAPQGLGGKGNRFEHEAHAACCAISCLCLFGLLDYI